MKISRQISKVLESLKAITKPLQKIPRWFNKQPAKTRAAVIISLMVAAWMLGPMLASGIQIYEGGWEVRTAIDTVFVNSKAYTQRVQPIQMYAPWGDQYIKFDVDEPKWGVPNLVVDIGAPREYYVDEYGDWVKAPRGVHFDHIDKPVGDTYYFWDHYVFRYHVKVIAEPDYNPGGGIDATEGEAIGLALVETALTTVRTKFTLDPFSNRLFDRIETEDANYTLDENKVFVGVMSAKVAAVTAGFVGYAEGTEPDGHGGKTIVADQTGTLNQYYTLNPADPPLNVIDVPAEVFIDVSGELAPAYRWDIGFLGIGGIMNLYAVQFEYTIEVHCLATAGYDLEEGNMDDDMEDAIFDKDAGSDPIGDTLRAAADWAVENLGPMLPYLLPILGVVLLAIVLYFFGPALIMGAIKGLLKRKGK